MSESFSESKYCTDSLSVCPTPVCTRKHKNDHVGSASVLQLAFLGESDSNIPW